MNINEVRFVVVGGGIAGVSCAEAILAYEPQCGVTIVSASPIVKAVRNLQEISRTLASFEVQETHIDDYVSDKPQITICRSAAKSVDHVKKILTTEAGDEIPYDKLCVCTGARPKLIYPENKHVIGIRDTATIEELNKKLKTAQRVVIVGNGGIATELVFQISNCDVTWVIKDNAIGQVFFDPGAAKFFLPLLNKKKECRAESDKETKTTIKRMNYKLERGTVEGQKTSFTGNALGPDWHQSLKLKGSFTGNSNIDVQYNCEVKAMHHSRDVTMTLVDRKLDGQDWPLFVELTNGQFVGCDFVVSATGVVPNVDIFKDLPCTLSEDGGVVVDQNMRVLGLNDVYAAGDVCSTANWPREPHWIQMRLWTQARQMGIFSARCMIENFRENLKSKSEYNDADVPLDICFSLFTHVTNFFGQKICLLGRYNGQDLNRDEIELLVRTTPGEEYIKVVLLNGRIQGAVLIGESDLEETFENLIMNETDVAYLGEDLLNPDVDIADYFD